MSVTKRTVNDELPDNIFDGVQKIARIEYVAESPDLDEDVTEWLNKHAIEGWELVTFACGLFCFRRDEYCVYREVSDRLIRVRIGDNS